MRHAAWIGIAVVALCAGYSVSVRAEETRFDWAQASEIAPGIGYVESAFTLEDATGMRCPHYPEFDPEAPRRIRRFAVRIDGREPSLRFAVTGRAQAWGERMPGEEGEGADPLVIRTRRETTLSFARSIEREGRAVSLAVNAAPWSPFRAGLTHRFADRMGLTVSDGVLVSPSHGRRPSLVIDADGGLELRTVSADAGIENIRQAVSGFAFSLVDGEPTGRQDVLHPRTGYGLCAERRYLVILVVDGRQAASQGATVREVGQWLRHYGAWNGLNMDGGGSTTLVLRRARTGALEVRNRPSGGQRMNAIHFGVYLEAPPSP